MSGTGRPLAAPPPPARRSWFTRRRIVASAALGAGCVAIVVMLAFRPHKPPPEPPPPPARASGPTWEPPAKVVHAVAQVAAPPQPSPPSFVAPTPPTPPTSLQMPTGPSGLFTPPPKRPAVYSFSGQGNALPEYMKPKAPAADAAAPVASTSIAYKSAVIDGVKTATIADRNLKLLPGPIICIMDTAINTDVAGPFQCHLDRDVLSSTNVTLMEKGTKVLGGYTSSVTQGQSRVIAVTANAITANGVMVPLGGPIADQRGAGGVEGSVDNRWPERLGGALLLSLIDSGFSLAQAELQKAGSTNLNISSGGGGINTLASQLLAKTINIPPTITLNQGTTVALWNTGIIDFGPSYRLEMAR